MLPNPTRAAWGIPLSVHPPATGGTFHKTGGKQAVLGLADAHMREIG